MAINKYSPTAASMRSNGAQILKDSGYPIENVLRFVDFPKVKGMCINGNFDVVRFLDKDYKNAGSGVAINNVNNRYVENISLQRERETICEVSFNGYYPNQILSLKESKRKEIASEKSIIMNFMTRGDILRIWFDGDLYYSVFPDDKDGSRYIAPGTTGFNLYEIAYPIFKVFPQRMKIEYSSSKAIADSSTGYHPPYYISGEISFVSLLWEQVMNFSFSLYYEVYSYAATLTNIMEIDISNWTGIIERSYVNVGEGATAIGDSYMNKTIFDVDFFNREEGSVKKEEVMFREVGFKYPRGWKLPV